ncbi:hypothetical protein PVAND_006166 [Polypedilum vanderplanki]|uniref:Cytochrome P450 4aa1 n=1 Tax=Polypedilum vanderplanki TaxID=319348 RepID=A0A9J6C369_POLVA|nr:hypothetical protein PVAND_006166 [Polypedilum vanderplanki]
MIWQALERASMFDMSVFLTVTLVSFILYTLSDYIKIALLVMRIPGPPAYPFFGNCFMATQRNLLATIGIDAPKQYGLVSRVWLMIFPFFVILDPEHLQLILGSKRHTNKSFFYKLLHNFLGDGLITSSGAKWAAHRRYIQPTFHLHILEKFVETFADSAQCLTAKMNNLTDKPVNITNIVNECVLDILNEAVLGVPIYGKKEGMENSPFRQGKVVVQDRVARPWLMFNWIYKFTEDATEELLQKKRLDDFTRTMINKRRDIVENGKIEGRKSLLDYMIEISKKHPDFTEEDIVNEACTFMLAGQDSVGASLAFAMFLLAQNPEHQQKCIEEIDAIFGSDDRAPTMADLREMKYLEMCIKEALRLYPAVPIMARRLGEDVQCGKYLLPAGAEIFIMPYITHRLEHIYPDPEAFIPERFTTENIEKRNPYAYLPFSAGPRNCIGHKFAIIEMKTIISKVLRSFRLKSVPGKETFEPLFRITLRAGGGLWVQLEPRNNNTM